MSVFTTGAKGKETSRKTDLSIKLTTCPDYVVPGETLRNKIRVTAINSGDKAVEATVELILSRRKDYVCPVPFAVYCPTYKDYVLLKGGRMLVSLPPGATEITFKGSNAIPPDTKEGVYYIGAVIDAGNMVPETNEKNNAYFKKVYVTKQVPKDQKPDLEITTADVVVTPKRTPDVPVMVFTVTVENKGKGIYKALPVPATLRVEDSTKKWTAELAIPTLMPGEYVELALPLMEYKKDPSYMAGGRVHKFYVVIDSGKIPESNKKNNVYGPLEVTIPKVKQKVQKQEFLPDLVVKDIVFVKECIVGVILQNAGKGKVPDSVWETQDGEKARVVLYLFDKKWSDKSITEVDPMRQLQEPGSEMIYKPGLKIRVKGRIKVAIDPLNFVKEENEKNNSKTVTLFCKRRPDLQISRILVIPKRPRVKKPVELHITVKNTGKAAAGKSSIAVFVGNERKPKLFGISRLRPGRSATIVRTVKFVRAERKKLVAVADYRNEVRELKESNNKKVAFFKVYK